MSSDIYYNTDSEVAAFQWVSDKDKWPPWIDDLHDKNRILIDAAKNYYLLGTLMPDKLKEGDWVVRYSDSGIQIRTDKQFTEKF